MALLRIPLGCLTSAILRLLIAVAVLAAAYFLFVKPALDDAGHAIQRGQDRLAHCLERSHGDPHRVTRCTDKL